jgi:hypothetical protein
MAPLTALPCGSSRLSWGITSMEARKFFMGAKMVNRKDAKSQEFKLCFANRAFVAVAFSSGLFRKELAPEGAKQVQK